MLPVWIQAVIALGNLAYQGFRVWLDYRDKIQAEDIKACSIEIERARKSGDTAKLDELLKNMREKQKCEP
jgi:hypothetical protein